jgi:type I restriction enzyme M protein
MIDRVRRDLTDRDIEIIAGTHHAWRGDVAQASSPASSSGVSPHGSFRDETSRKLAAGTAALHKYDDIPGVCKSATLEEQFAESAKLEKAIRQNLKLFRA